MSYVTYPHFNRDDVVLGRAVAGPSRRARLSAAAFRRASSLLGGGTLFAATLYLLIVLIAVL